MSRPFRNDSSPPAARGRAAVEVVLLVGLLGGDLWWLRALDHPLPSVAAQGAILLLVISAWVRRRRAGARRPPRGAAARWGEPALLTAVAMLVVALLGAAVREGPQDELRFWALSWGLGDQLKGVLAAIARALMQQAGLLGLVWPAARDLLGDRPRALLVSAAIFAALHLPTPAFAAATFAVAIGWIGLYRRGATFAALVLSHAVLSPWTYAHLPERTLFDLHVGSKAVARTPNYRLLTLPRNRELLARLCDAGYVDRFASHEAYVADALPQILDRPATPEEVDFWAIRAEHRSRCTVAKMLAMSDELVPALDDP